MKKLLSRGAEGQRRKTTHKGEPVSWAGTSASPHNGGNPPSGSPVAYGGKPSFSTGLTASGWLDLRELALGLQPREQESKGAIAHKGRGFEPYLLSKKLIFYSSSRISFCNQNLMNRGILLLNLLNKKVFQGMTL